VSTRSRSFRSRPSSCAADAPGGGWPTSTSRSAATTAGCPIATRRFDGIVLNLVFEWCGSRLESESHDAAQTRLLERWCGC
jgi:hypothetical protein